MFRKLFRKAPAVPRRADLATDAGMLCVWDAPPFSGITDFDSWEAELCEDDDLLRHIRDGHLVPLNLGDGVFAVELREGLPDSMSEREREYLLVPSLPYLLRSSGRVFISGLEQVGATPRTYLELRLKPGQYTVQVALIDWTQEPGAIIAPGKPSPDALPDMIVFIHTPNHDTAEYRQNLETFRKEDSLR